MWQNPPEFPHKSPSGSKIFFCHFGFCMFYTRCGNQCHNKSQRVMSVSFADSMVQTHNSLPQTEGALPSLSLPEAAQNAHWSESDEIMFIQYITDNKAEAGDGVKFKPLFWTGAAQMMLVHSEIGGTKMSQACSSKWDRVRTYLPHAYLLADMSFTRQLKKAYNVVSILKSKSGFPYDDKEGCKVTLKTACAWNEYIVVSTIDPLSFYFTKLLLEKQGRKPLQVEGVSALLYHPSYHAKHRKRCARFPPLAADPRGNRKCAIRWSKHCF